MISEAFTFIRRGKDDQRRETKPAPRMRERRVPKLTDAEVTAFAEMAARLAARPQGDLVGGTIAVLSERRDGKAMIGEVARVLGNEYDVPSESPTGRDKSLVERVKGLGVLPFFDIGRNGIIELQYAKKIKEKLDEEKRAQQLTEQAPIKRDYTI